jgi:hypothetical protein
MRRDVRFTPESGHDRRANDVGNQATGFPLNSGVVRIMAEGVSAT